MDAPFDSPDWDLGRPVSPNQYRHRSNFSNQSLFSVSSYASDINLTIPFTNLSRTNSHRKPPKYRMQKLIKSSLKHTLKTNKSDSTNLEYWDAFYKKLRKIITAFNDPLCLYEALNDPYSGKSSKKTCSSIIHILCKQFYLYSRSNNWTVCFKIYDCIEYVLNKGANTSIFYTKLTETPQRNYNSIHTLYQGLQIMLISEVITNKQFVNYFSRAISAGNQHIHNALISDIHEKNRNSILSVLSESSTSMNSISLLSIPSSTTSNASSGNEMEVWMDNYKTNMGGGSHNFVPAVLTLCMYEIEEDEWQNITYWLGDCLYNDYYVNLISPYLAKVFIMMGYDLFHIVLAKFDHLDFNKKEKMSDLIVENEVDILDEIRGQDYRINKKVIAFLWFIRFGNFKNDLINIIDIGIKQLALNEFVIKQDIIEIILQYSHYYLMSHYNDDGNDSSNILSLSYVDNWTDKWMRIAFEILFKLDNKWIDWIGQYVVPNLSKLQTNKIKRNLAKYNTEKQWNKFIRRISLFAINSFCKYDIFGNIDSTKMQNIILKNYKNSNNFNDFIQILYNANYDIVQTFGSNLILYKIINDNSIENREINQILCAIHSRINNELDAKLIINDLLFGNKNEWKTNQSIWRNILLVFESQYKYFNLALNDLFYELTTQQHHKKFIFFMKNNVIDFNYCLRKDLLNIGLQSFITEHPFNKKASCVQLIGDWIYTNFNNEKDDIRKKEISQKSIVAITNNITNSNVSQQQDTVIIQQYLRQLKNGLSS